MSESSEGMLTRDPHRRGHPADVDPRITLLDQALMTLDTYRLRSPKMRSAASTWRSSDAARIIAALPAVGLVLVTKDAFEDGRHCSAQHVPGQVPHVHVVIDARAVEAAGSSDR